MINFYECFMYTWKKTCFLTVGFKFYIGPLEQQQLNAVFLT